MQYHTSRKGRLLRACGEKAKRRMGGVGAGANGRSSCRGGETSKTRDASLRAAGFEKAEAACRVHVLVLCVSHKSPAQPQPQQQPQPQPRSQPQPQSRPRRRRRRLRCNHSPTLLRPCVGTRGVSTIWLCLCVKSTHRYSVLPRRPALLYPALPCPAPALLKHARGPVARRSGDGKEEDIGSRCRNENGAKMRRSRMEWSSGISRRRRRAACSRRHSHEVSSVDGTNRRK